MLYGWWQRLLFPWHLNYNITSGGCHHLMDIVI
jgi:hypothetical protein